MDIVNIIKLDFITIKRKSFLPFILIMSFMFVISLFTLAHQNVVMIVFAGLIIEPVFAISEQSDYNKLYGILPIKRENIVFGRFAFGLLAILSVTIFSILLGYIAYGFSFNESFEATKDFAELANIWQNGGITIGFASAFCFFFACCLAAVEYTLLFVFGVSRQFLSTLGFTGTILFFAFLFIKIFNIDIGSVINKLGIIATENNSLAMAIFYVGGVIMMVIGGLISSFFFCKKEL